MESDEPDIEIDLAEEFGAHRVESQRFSIYVPNKDRNGAEIDQAGWVDRFVRLLSEIGGGATIMPPVDGAWMNEETGDLIFEQPRIVYSFVRPAAFQDRLQDLVDLVKEMGRETNQGEVVFEFDGDFFVIDDFT